MLRFWLQGSGRSSTGASGAGTLSTGAASSGSSGSMTFKSGAAAAGRSGEVEIMTGDAADASGSIALQIGKRQSAFTRHNIETISSRRCDGNI